MGRSMWWSTSPMGPNSERANRASSVLRGRMRRPGRLTYTRAGSTMTGWQARFRRRIQLRSVHENEIDPVTAGLLRSVLHEGLGAKHEHEPGVDGDFESDGVYSTTDE